NYRDERSIKSNTDKNSCSRYKNLNKNTK
ncbi:hypothetical protein ACTFIZ_000556, partial [Dictyostelium cf. discoideum]